MTRAEYLAIDALNFSGARHLLRSPAHYKAALEEPEDELRYVVGKLAHAMILEGKDLRDMYAIKPGGIKLSTKKGKTWKAEQTLPILKEEDANRIPRMAEAIASHPAASRALKHCTQREAFKQSLYAGVPIKGIIDAYGSEFIDVKTTIDARESAFRKRIDDLDYDMQCVFYKKLLLDSANCAWIAVENFPPFAVNVWYPSFENLILGKQKMDLAIMRYKLCQQSGDWSAYQFEDYSQDIREISPPIWRIKELEGAGLI